MTRRHVTKIAVMFLIMSFTNAGFCSSFLSGSSSRISSNADNYLINSINKPLPFVTTAWSMLSTYYAQNSSFAPANIYAINTSFLPGVNSIANSNYGTLEIRYGATAPGPLANNGYALAPTRVTLKAKTFYVYELPQCFTNITDSLTSQQAPQAGTPIGLFGNSNLGTNCVYAPDPYSAAINQVQGSGTGTNTNPAYTPGGSITS